jgi:hypothetical protein
VYELPARGLMTRRWFGIRGSRLKASIRNAAQVVGGVGTDRAAHVSDEMWALFPEPTGQSSSLTGSERIVGDPEVTILFSRLTQNRPLTHGGTSAFRS